MADPARVTIYYIKLTSAATNTTSLPFLDVLSLHNCTNRCTPTKEVKRKMSSNILIEMFLSFLWDQLTWSKLVVKRDLIELVRVVALHVSTT